MKVANRKHVRLRGYDYSSSGWYYVTICTYKRRLFFGEIGNGKMILNEYGQIVSQIWQSLSNHHDVELNCFQIMPNHVHFIIQIVGATRGSPSNSAGGSRPAPTLGTVVGLFKSECSKQIHQIIDNPQFPIWQRSYYDHIIRNEKSLHEIKKYIQLNPWLWDRDRNNPRNISLPNQ